MKRSAKPIFDPDQAKSPAIVLDDSHGPTEGCWHTHRRAQLVHAAEGVITVQSEEGRWVAPPQRAVWVPPGVRHLVSSRRRHRLLTLYLEPSWAGALGVCRVVLVDRLLEELLLAAAAFGASYPCGGHEERLFRVLLDRLTLSQVAPLHLPSPKSAALCQIAAALTAEPSSHQTLEGWGEIVGVAPRTLARRFVSETQMTFGQWRQQLRLLLALERLGAGESVTGVAFAVGYEDVSSFIHVFKASLGTTPARYFSRLSPNVGK